MATGGDPWQLTNKQIARLARTIAADDMESIAEGYMDIEPETVKNIRCDASNSEAFNRDVIRHWSNKNPTDQVKKLENLLHEAASDCGYVDLNKVEEILSQQAAVPEKSSQVTEDEFLTLADKLRPYTEKAMKLEVAPWLRDYLVEMDKLYTELTLEKTDNKAHGQVRRKLENYKVIFEPGMFEYLYIRYYIPENIRNNIPSFRPKKKILKKGDPGMGKTSLVKKISYDWARGDFDEISIVFFVFLKSVKPDEAIESAIVSQTPALQGLHVTKEKIAGILERFGDQCLIIFDGLDEYAFGQNEDVLKIVKGAKWLHANVIVTSRSHTAKQIERYCDAIVSVEGFTRSEAKKFASRIVDDHRKVNQIVDFNPNKVNKRETSENEAQHLHNVPILLSFLCVLVREDDIDLTDRSISVGDIYFRMVRCLYRKYTIRKRVNFKMTSFLGVLTSLGKLALETLFKSPFFQRREVIEEVGPDAFDYGLLIGHEDFRLIRDETADILLTFPHQSLHEFLGAFYFVLSLSKETNLQNFTKAAKEFMTNPLFHQFCLWWLDFSQLTEICPSWNRQWVQELLANHAAAQINRAKIDMMHLAKRFPAFDAILNEKAFTLLGTVLGKCDKLRHLGTGYKYLPTGLKCPTSEILSSLGPLFKSLRSIGIPSISEIETGISIGTKFEKEIKAAVDQLNVCHTQTDNDLIIVLRGGDPVSALVDIYKACEQWKRSPFVYIDSRNSWYDQFELAELSNETVKGLYLLYRWKVLCNKDIPRCPKLTHLILDGQDFKDFAEGFSVALWNSKLPRLTHLSLAKGTMGCLSSFFQSKCSSLTHLDLSRVELELRDLKFLHSVNANEVACALPNLSSLTLNVEMSEEVSALQIVFQNSWNKLTEIRFVRVVHDEEHYHIKKLASIIFNDSKVPNLVALQLEGVCGDLNSLDERKVPQLKSLTLKNYKSGPHEELLGYLAETSSAWELEKLDISHNYEVGGNLHLLQSNNFPALKSLIVTYCELSWRDLRSLGVANESSRLPKLTHLDISGNKGIAGNLPLLLRLEFRSLQDFIVRDCQLKERDLRDLARVNAKGKLPQLKYLDISENDLKKSLEFLTRDPDRDGKLSWKRVKCEDGFLGDDYDHVSDEDDSLSDEDDSLSDDDDSANDNDDYDDDQYFTADDDDSHN